MARVFEVEISEITMESSIGDFPKWDSLGYLNLLQEIQYELDIEFDSDEIFDLEDVNDIIKLAEKKSEEK